MKGTIRIPAHGPTVFINPTTAASFSLEYVATTKSTSNATTYTFTAHDIGAADSSRVVVTSAGGTPSADVAETLNTLTVQAISGSEVVTACDAGHWHRCSIWTNAVPTGTTGDIVVTFSNGMSRCIVGVYRMLNGNATATSTGTDITISTDTLSASLTIPSGGGGIGLAMTRGNANPTTLVHAWTNLTENFDALVESGSAYSGALSTTPGAVTVSVVTSVDTLLDGTFVVAAWGA